MSTRGVTTMNKHGEYYFRDGNICFLVENTIFRLHRHFFERESDYFRERLNPSSEGEDGSPNSPYIIHDVKSDEFAHFVWVWYNPQYTFSKQEKQKWLTILRLATLWRFHEIRKLAIRHLEKLKLEPIEKITTYKQYSVDSELLLPSYVSLCRSPKLPSPAEGKILTMETVLKLASARERMLLSASEHGCKTPTTASLPDEEANALVAELFSLTLHSNDQAVGVGGQPLNNGSALGNSFVDPEVVTVKQPKKGKVNNPPDLSLLSQNGTGSGSGRGKTK
ncbi:hypothetical protein J3R82DRAFT_1401 [Butyriboletus roseoflavus]|nr:hypothetical protein J3R82DRAFT_1401 [Butyriboletus roseoflavus]